MAQKSHGSQHGARHKHSSDRHTTENVNDHFKNFDNGEKVKISFHPSVQKGRTHTRFHGQTATVTGERGDAFELEVQDGNKSKTLFLKSVHIQKLSEE